MHVRERSGCFSIIRRTSIFPIYFLLISAFSNDFIFSIMIARIPYFYKKSNVPIPTTPSQRLRSAPWDSSPQTDPYTGSHPQTSVHPLTSDRKGALYMAEQLTLTWIGHSCFKLDCGDYTIVFDPYEDGYVPGCPPVRESADLVGCRHLIRLQNTWFFQN